MVFLLLVFTTTSRVEFQSTSGRLRCHRDHWSRSAWNEPTVAFGVEKAVDGVERAVDAAAGCRIAGDIDAGQADADEMARLRIEQAAAAPAGDWFLARPQFRGRAMEDGDGVAPAGPAQMIVAA